MPGPLSPGYAAQVPYNYNQLEGRFKQLQGKPMLFFFFFFCKCCYDMIPVNMLAWACSRCIKALTITEAKRSAMAPSFVCFQGGLCDFYPCEGVLSFTALRCVLSAEPLSRMDED